MEQGHLLIVGGAHVILRGVSEMMSVQPGPQYTFINHDVDSYVEMVDAWLDPCGHMHNRAMGYPHPWVCNLYGPCADGTKINE